MRKQSIADPRVVKTTAKNTKVKADDDNSSNH